MKVTAVFTACLALAVAQANHLWIADEAAVPSASHVHWIPSSRNAALSSKSAIPVKVARSLFRTFGLEQPSDAEIMSFTEAAGYSDVDAAEKLRSLYSEPALIFLEDADNNVVAYYADSGLNKIRAYPATHANLKSLLGASNAVVLAYKPERLLYPADRDEVSSRFFAPKNFRIEPLTAFARAAENYRVVDAPVVFRKFEIPSHYVDARSPYDVFDIDKIPYAYKSPVTLKAIDAAEYPLWKEAIPSPVHAIDADSSISAYRSLPIEHYTSNLNHYCAKNPLACAKLEKINADSDVIPATVLKAYPQVPAIYPSNSPALKTVHILDTDASLDLCDKYPHACAANARAVPYLKSSAVPISDSSAYIPKSLEIAVPILKSTSPLAPALSAWNLYPPHAAVPISLENARLNSPEAAYKYNGPIVVSAGNLETSNPLAFSTASPASYAPISLENARLIAPPSAAYKHSAPLVVSAGNLEASNPLAFSTASPASYAPISLETARLIAPPSAAYKHSAPLVFAADNTEASNPTVVSAASPTPYANAKILKPLLANPSL